MAAKLRKYMTAAELEAVRSGSSTHFLGARENWVRGDTMRRLERGGLADVITERRPHRRLVYRLTDEGGMMRAQMLIEEEQACVCRPGLVESGGFSSRCPVHGWDG